MPDREQPAARRTSRPDERGAPWAIGFETLEREVDDDELSVQGSIPPWLEGTLVRNGPARFEAGERELNHWFDGYAMLHAFAVEDGAVTYANRFLDTRAHRAAREGGPMAVGEFGTDPCRSIFERFFHLFDPDLTDNASVNVGRLAGEFVALTETPIPVRFDPDTLETRGRLEWSEPVDGQLTTAHPHHDPERGETVNYVTKIGRQSTYNVFAVPDGTARRRLLGRVDVDRPAYMHSFGLTPDHVVLAEFPFVADPLGTALSSDPFVGNLEWRPERGTRWWVLDRDTGDVVANPRGPALFAFHHVNAFEDGGEIVVDLCAYPDASVVHELFLDQVRDEPPSADAAARPTRVRVPLDGGPVGQETLVDEALELPRTWYGEVNGRPYRYAYGVGHRHDPPRAFLNQLVKVDVEARETRTWSQPGAYPGEPVFVPRPDAGAEDDGVLLSVVLDAEAGTSLLLVLDAASMEEIARAPAPHRIPFGFHGAFVEGGG